MNNLDKQYQQLLQDILNNGVKKVDRTGTGTISLFGRQIRHKMSEGFPLLTTKKVHWKSIVVELLWFLRGDINIKYLLDNDVSIWNGDCYKRYHSTPIDQIKVEHKFELPFGNQGENGVIYKHNNYVHWTKQEFFDKIKTDDDFATTWGDLGPIYGSQWRKWNTNKSVVIGHNGYYNEWGTIIIDQISNLINTLKTNPDDRRMIVNAWNVGELD